MQLKVNIQSIKQKGLVKVFYAENLMQDILGSALGDGFKCQDAITDWQNIM